MPGGGAGAAVCDACAATPERLPEWRLSVAELALSDSARSSRLLSLAGDGGGSLPVGRAEPLVGVNVGARPAVSSSPAAAQSRMTLQSQAACTGARPLIAGERLRALQPVSDACVQFEQRVYRWQASVGGHEGRPAWAPRASTQQQSVNVHDESRRQLASLREPVGA
jgi:hypothetical protein